MPSFLEIDGCTSSPIKLEYTGKRQSPKAEFYMTSNVFPAFAVEPKRDSTVGPAKSRNYDAQRSPTSPILKRQGVSNLRSMMNNQNVHFSTAFDKRRQLNQVKEIETDFYKR